MEESFIHAVPTTIVGNSGYFARRQLAQNGQMQEMTAIASLDDEGGVPHIHTSEAMGQEKLTIRAESPSKISQST